MTPGTGTSASRTCSRATCAGPSNRSRKVLELNPRSIVGPLQLRDLLRSTRATSTPPCGRAPGWPRSRRHFRPAACCPSPLRRCCAATATARWRPTASWKRRAPSGKSLGRFGRADLQMYLGQYPDAIRTLQEAIAADGKAGDNGKLARDYVAAAESYLAAGQVGSSRGRGTKGGTAHHRQRERAGPRGPGPRGCRPARRSREARPHAGEHAPDAHDRVRPAHLRGGRGASRAAMPRPSSSSATASSGGTPGSRVTCSDGSTRRPEHFPEALAELDAAIKRRGEAADVFFYDTPTARYLPPALYWLARTKQALGRGRGPRPLRAVPRDPRQRRPPDPLAPTPASG